MTAKEKLLRALRAFSKDRDIGRKEEKGVALIFTLGILALLLVLALAFATSAMTERKAASNNNDYVVARMIAMSGVNRAIAGMSYGATQYDNFDKVFSQSNDTNIAAADTNKFGKYDFLYHIATTIDGINSPWPSDYKVDSPSALHWQYVQDGTAANKIIGRFAYLTSSGYGRLDPSAAVDSSCSMLPSAQAGPLAEDSPLKKRPGVYVSEIYLGNLDTTGTYLASADIPKWGVASSSPSGLLADNTAWASADNCFSTVGITDVSKKIYIEEQLLDFRHTPDPETYWVDVNSNKRVDTTPAPSEEYNRFDLWRADWNTINITTILGDYSAGGINWLHNFGKDPSTDSDDSAYLSQTNFASVDARRNQIAANLKDYCDSDNIATNDDGNSFTTPTYMGLEKCPYINEVRLQFQCAVIETPIPSTSNSTYTITFTVTSIVELVNMYRGTFTPIATIKWDLEYDRSSGPGGSETAQTYSTDISVSSFNIGSQSYQADSKATTIWSVAAFTAASGGSYGVTNVKVKNLKVKLNGPVASPDYYDCALLEETSTGTYPTLATLRSGNGTGNWYVDYEVDDPRQNLNRGDWSRTVSTTTANGTISTSSTTGKNSNCNPNPDSTGVLYDAETGATEPWMVSTAYIRNARMESPWELGVIHRALKWQTLNLKSYDKSDSYDGVSKYAGGRKYNQTSTGSADGGDANILDQIKFGSNADSYGKVNLRSATTQVLGALLAEIYVPTYSTWTSGSTDAEAFFADPGSHVVPAPATYTNLELSSPKLASTLASKIGDYAATNVLKTRAQVACVNALSGRETIAGLTLNNDAKKEAIIGKFINLTKARTSDTFTIIAIGQAIRDVGDGRTVKKFLLPPGATGESTTTCSGLAFGDISGIYPAQTITDPVTVANCQFGKYDKYADEILSEQKIIATVHRDTTTGVWRIIKLEYIGE